MVKMHASFSCSIAEKIICVTTKKLRFSVCGFVLHTFLFEREQAG